MDGLVRNSHLLKLEFVIFKEQEDFLLLTFCAHVIGP